MKRDMDLVRKIMLAVEGAAGQPDLSDLHDEYSERVVTYHCAIILRAGLVNGMVNEEDLDGSVFCVLTSLTWEGHDFLDNARNDTIWNKGKELAMKTAGSLSVDALKAALAIVVRQVVSGEMG
jgi:hypothetical protein